MDKPDFPIAVKVKDVSKSFKTGDMTIEALKSIDLEIRRGELMMIVGPSGCGKTTLLSVIAGTLNFDRGEIEVLGESLNRMKEEQITEFRKKNIGFIFQQFHLIKTLTCLENVSIPLLLNQASISVSEEKASLILKEVGLEGRENDYPKFLSGGQQQRVAIARALIHEPSLIICDEPTASLDADTGISIMNLLKSIVERSGRTVIIVTHDNRIFKYADRLCKMDDGKIRNIQDDRINGEVAI